MLKILIIVMIISKIFFCIQKEIQFFVVPKLDYHKKNVMNIKLRSLDFAKGYQKIPTNLFKKLKLSFCHLPTSISFYKLQSRNILQSAKKENKMRQHWYMMTRYICYSKYFHFYESAYEFVIRFYEWTTYSYLLPSLNEE